MGVGQFRIKLSRWDRQVGIVPQLLIPYFIADQENIDIDGSRRVLVACPLATQAILNPAEDFRLQGLRGKMGANQYGQVDEIGARAADRRRAPCLGGCCDRQKFLQGLDGFRQVLLRLDVRSKAQANQPVNFGMGGESIIPDGVQFPPPPSGQSGLRRAFRHARARFARGGHPSIFWRYRWRALPLSVS